MRGADLCGGFLYTSCAPVGTANLSASLQDFLCQLHTNSRILLIANSLSFAAYSPQNPPVLLPPKSVCPAWDRPLSSVSGRKRYNTLDFPKENRVPTGMLLAPIGNPEPRDCIPLDTSHIFLENGTQTVKMQFDTFPQKIQNRCNLHPCEDENYSGFSYPLRYQR